MTVTARVLHARSETLGRAIARRASELAERTGPRPESGWLLWQAHRLQKCVSELLASATELSYREDNDKEALKAKVSELHLEVRRLEARLEAQPPPYV